MGHTSSRRSWNIRYISAVQRPMPRTVVRRARSSSSLRRDVRVSTTVPSRTLADRSRSEAILLRERPAVRRSASDRAATPSGVTASPSATRSRP